MLTKYLIFLLTPLSFVHLSYLIMKNKDRKLFVAVVIIAMIIILLESILILIEAYTPPPRKFI